MSFKINSLLRAMAWLQWAILQTYPLWLVLAVPLLAWPATAYMGDGGLKFYALALQLGGGWIATSAIRQNLQIFQAQGLRAAVVGWWGRRPIPRNTVIYANMVESASLCDSADVRMSVGRVPGDSAEAQLDKLWHGLQFLQSEVSSHRQDTKRMHDEAKAAIQDMRSSSDKRANDLHEVVKKVAASSPLYAYFGAWMAAVGTVLSTYTPEIVKAL